MFKIKILLIDDDKETRKTYKSIFKWANFSVIEAENGQEGYKKYIHHNPDVVFTGIDMPNVNGFKLIEKIKSLPGNPIILINSHHDRPEDRRKAEELEIDGFFVRGFSSAKNVVDVIKELKRTHVNEYAESSMEEKVIETIKIHWNIFVLILLFIVLFFILLKRFL